MDICLCLFACVCVRAHVSECVRVCFRERKSALLLLLLLFVCLFVCFISAETSRSIAFSCKIYCSDIILSRVLCGRSVCVSVCLCLNVCLSNSIGRCQSRALSFTILWTEVCFLHGCCQTQQQRNPGTTRLWFDLITPYNILHLKISLEVDSHRLSPGRTKRWH